MRRIRKKIEAAENSDRWLLTYADLITLLLAFFVIMYSMSQVDAKKFGEMAKAFNGVLRGGKSVFKNIDRKDKATGFGLLKLGDLNMIQKQIDKRFNNLGRLDEIQTELTERGLVVHIMESALFTEGRAELESKATEVLDIIYEKLQNIPNHIRVEGHTDNRIIKTDVYPSNWELSTSRATSVVRYFITNYKYPASKISALGYGEYRPIRPNNSIENRAINRRVDIVILTMDISITEPSSLYYNYTQNQ